MKDNAFLKIPKFLFKDGRFLKLSIHAKLLYGLLLDRMSLSRKNGWVDKDGKTYIYFTQNNVREYLSIGREKTMKIFAELESAELIFRKRQGLGKPCIIYVKDIISENTTCGDAENTTSKGSENRPQKVRETGSNKTDINKTEINKTDDTEIGREKTIAGLYKKLQYDILIINYDKTEIDTIVGLITEVICGKNNSITVGNRVLDNVKEKFGQLDNNHIEYVLECLKKSAVNVKNIRNYLLTALYNAPDTMDMYYTMQVRYDLLEARKSAVDLRARVAERLKNRDSLRCGKYA